MRFLKPIFLSIVFACCAYSNAQTQSPSTSTGRPKGDPRYRHLTFNQIGPPLTPNEERRIYEEFIRFFCREHLRIEKENSLRPSGQEPIDESIYYQSLMEIRHEDYNAILTYTFSAAEQLGKIDREVRELILQDQKKKLSERGPQPRFKELQNESDAILTLYIANLRRELGEEHFRSADRFIKMEYGNVKFATSDLPFDPNESIQTTPTGSPQ